MAARPLQPSEYEIQREVEALKDLRRRSTTPGALTIDPDLPNQTPAASPTPLWPGKVPISPISAEGSSSNDHSDSSGSSRSTDAPNNPADDPLHLFWVPASLHPEIAPAEFRAFLKEHARSPVDGEDDASSASSSSLHTPATSLSASSSLSRKKSMLSRQYRPKENDGVEDENIVPLKRNRSLLYPTNQGPQLTISDLRMLEELVEEASESSDPSKLRSVLRRSLSLNISPSAAEVMDDSSEMGDEADAPIIVPPPGQILRRAARTKIRKPNLQGDGGGHRFPASRRGTAKPHVAASPAEPRTSSDVSSSDHGDGELSAVPRRLTMSDDGSQGMGRPESYSEESAIYDAYVRDDDEDDMPGVIVPEPEPAPIQVQEPPLPPAEPILHQPQPQRLVPPPQEHAQPSRTPSPTEHIPAPIPIQQPRPQSAPPLQAQQQQPHVRKDKASKSLFKWGSDKDKGGKKGAKEKERERAEKDSGFFGSLFGGGKKKQDTEYASSLTGGTSGREAAQALLGASKSSKAHAPPPSPGLAPGIGGNPYARYPIHVERAIYRLSHIKLANPRRPLYEQVLISNLMFWYLGVINKAQNPTPASPTTEGAAGAPNGTGEQGDAAEREERERAQREKEAREKEAREKAEQEQREQEQREREQREAQEAKRKESGRRGSLTKTPAGGPAGGGRRAEMPIKGPQYEMQHRVMEQEYGGYNGGAPPRSPTTAGPMQNGHPPSPQRAPQPGPYVGPHLGGQPPQVRGGQPDPYYYQPQPQPAPMNHRPGLPPGAMQPDQGGWGAPPPQARGQRASPPPGHQGHPHPQQRRHPSPNPGAGHHRRSQSPPQQQQQQQQKAAAPPTLHRLNTSQENLGHGAAPRSGGRSPARSLSATAYTSPPLPQANGAALRKGNSAHAAAGPYDRPRHMSEGRPSEEEDVPLAVYQQQRRK